MNRIEAFKYICSLGICLLFITSTFAQQTEVNLASDSTRLRIGEQSMVRLRVSHPPSQAVSMPVLVDTINGLEIVQHFGIDTTQSASNLINETLRVRVTSFDSGLFTLGPLAVATAAGDTVYSNELLFYFNSVPVNPEADIKPIKDIRGAPITFMDTLPWLILALIVGGIIAGIINYFTRRKPAEVKVPKVVKADVPPHVIALRKLDELQEEKLWQQGEVKAYYVALTDIVREYIERRFKVLAMESTTDEILAELSAKDIDFKQKGILQNLLERADLAKFAKSKPGAGQNMESIEIARQFVQETKVEKQPEEETDTSANGRETIEQHHNGSNGTLTQ